MMHRRHYFPPFFLLVVIYIIGSSYSAGITGRSITGCGGASCHAMNSNTMILLTGIPATGFKYGITYPMVLSVINLSKAAAGFNLRCDIGEVVAGSDMLNNGTKELYHSSPQLIINAAGIASWQFTWTAPASGNEVSFFVAGNSVNNDTASSLDEFNTDAFYFQADTTQPNNIIEPKKIEQVKLYPNPCQGYIVVEQTKFSKIQVLNWCGQLMEVKQILLSENKTQLDFSNVSKGTYFINCQARYFAFTCN